MAKFKFPRNPGTDRTSPFEDEHGDNPFSDGTPAPAKVIPGNLFSAPEDGEGRSYTPDDYEAALVPNSNRSLVLAIIGVVMSALGVGGVGLGIAGVGTWASPLFVALPVQFAALATAAPACIMATRDLRAMRAGAMSRDSRRKSRLALVLGVCGILLGATPVVAYFALLFYAALFS